MRYDFISALTTLINEKNWQLLHSFVILYTGKSFSEPRILASTNPQYDKRLFIEFTSSVHENYKLRTSGEHVVYINCSECQNKNNEQCFVILWVS